MASTQKDQMSPAVARDKRLQLVGQRKSGYCGHVPKCIYYDRERLPASIHTGNNLPPRGKLQLDGTMRPTQSMVREEQRKAAVEAARFAASGNGTNSRLESPRVATVNEIGLSAQHAGSEKKISTNTNFAADTDVNSSNGPHSMADLARPFSQNPSGNGKFGHYSATLTRSGGPNMTGTGGQFSASMSPPRSPTARYYQQIKDSEHDPDHGPHPATLAVTSLVPRYRHEGAGGVCSGRTDPYQYGRFLHHDDKEVHGSETKLLPHVYGADRPPRNLGKEFNSTMNESNGMLRVAGAGHGSSSAPNTSTGRGISYSGYGSGAAAVPTSNNTASPSHVSQSANHLTPFPRYPVLRGPNRMGPRGLESFLSN